VSVLFSQTGIGRGPKTFPRPTGLFQEAAPRFIYLPGGKKAYKKGGVIGQTSQSSTRDNYEKKGVLANDGKRMWRKLGA